MIYENHDFDNDSAYHDFLVAMHTTDLTEEFAQLGKSLSDGREGE